MTYQPEYAIWERKDKNGDTYLSLKTPDGKWVTFFRNRFYKDKAPMWKQARALPDKEDLANANSFGPPPEIDNEIIPF